MKLIETWYFFWQKANTWNISFRNSKQQLFYMNSVDRTKSFCNTPSDIDAAPQFFFSKFTPFIHLFRKVNLFS